MKNVSYRNMLGAFLVGMTVLTIAMPAFGAEDVITATKEIPAVAEGDVKTETSATISKEDLAALKTALDGLQGVVASLSTYVQKLPKESKEREQIATKLSATLSAMKMSLIALHGTLAAANVVSVKNLAQKNPVISVPDKTDSLASKSTVSSEEGVATVTDLTAKKDVEDQGILSLIKTSLNSPPGVIVLLVFAMIFGVVVFMRVSSKKEAQTA